MNDALKVFGIFLLGLFVLVVALPLIGAALGLVFATAIGIAILLIKVAVVLAIGYLALAGIRALMR
jgi:hypothetical protein